MLASASRIALSAALAVLAACQGSSPSLYEWGDYEDSVLDICESGGASDVGAEIQRFVEVIERSDGEGKRVPPGTHAHLGYLYAMQGDMDATVAAFESEKELYPESTVFIDGLLTRMGATK